MSAGSERGRSRGPLGQKIFVQVLGFFCCVCLPLLVSAIAPVSVVQLTWHNERVSADVTTRSFYFIPYRHVVVDEVLSVDDRVIQGKTTRDRDRREHTSESEAFLVFHGPDTAAKVSVSPVNLRDALEKARAFIAQPNSAGLRLTVVANWKFGVIAPLLLSPLLLIYLIGITLTIWRWLSRKQSSPG